MVTTLLRSSWLAKEGHVMRMDNIGYMSLAIWSIILLFVLYAVYYFLNESSSLDKSNVIQERLFCVSSVCIESKGGFDCLNIAPKVTSFRLIKSSNKNEWYQILLVPTQTNCFNEK